MNYMIIISLPDDKKRRRRNKKNNYDLDSYTTNEKRAK